MTDPERDHLLERILDLERSRGRWRLGALVLAVILCLPIGLGSLLGLAWLPGLQRDRMRAMEAEMQAREAAAQAERARLEARQARDLAEAQRQQLEQKAQERQKQSQKAKD
jgi:hypothetical protein